MKGVCDWGSSEIRPEIREEIRLVWAGKSSLLAWEGLFEAVVSSW